MIRAEGVPTDPVELRRAYGRFPTGVAAMCALEDGRPVGMAASSFTAVSIDPPLVSVCIQRTSSTWPRLRNRPLLGVSVLAEGQDAACRALAGSGDRFADVSWDEGDDGAVLVRGAAVWLQCTLHEEVAAGDHEIVVLQVRGMHTLPDIEPLVFHGSQFRRLAALAGGPAQPSATAQPQHHAS